MKALLSLAAATAATALSGALLLAAPAAAAGVLTARNGMTLYTYDGDSGSSPNCYGACAASWPPYLGKAGARMGKSWKLVARTDGTRQWVHDGKPVYFFTGDHKRGETKGDGSFGAWHVVAH